MPHLLKVTLSGSGCGGGSLETEAPTGWSDPPTTAFNSLGITPCNPSGESQNPYSHWYLDPSDNPSYRVGGDLLPAPRALWRGATGSR